MPAILLDPLFFLCAAGLIGLCVGSFLNVVIHRLPQMLEHDWQTEAAALRGEPEPAPLELGLAKPRSRCPHCGHTLGALENIPLLSFIVLRGRCRHCGAGIGLRYPVVELLSAVLTFACAWHFGPGLTAISAMLMVWVLIALAVIDLDTQLLPDNLTLPLLWLGLLVNLWSLHAPLESAVSGAMVGYLALWSVYWLFKLVTGKEGMGYGDFKLLAAIGAWLGWQALPAVILLSSVVGATLGISLILFARHARETPIPFGPYLAAAGVLALFFGEALNRFLLGATLAGA